MKKLLVVCAISAVSTTHAFAGGKMAPAPEPYIPTPVAPVSTFDWTGAYGGVFLGYGNGTSRHCDGPNCAGGAPTFPSPNPSGGLGGVTLGYNFQHNNLVYGIELDHAVTRMRGTATSTATYGCGGAPGCRTNIDSMTTLRGRLGVAMDRTLVFGTAGLAHIRGKGGTTGSPQGSFSFSTPVIGAGVEHALTDRISLKGEVLHTLRRGSFNVQPGVCVAPGCQIDRVSTTTGRIGVNFRF